MMCPCQTTLLILSIMTVASYRLIEICLSMSYPCSLYHLPYSDANRVNMCVHMEAKSATIDYVSITLGVSGTIDCRRSFPGTSSCAPNSNLLLLTKFELRGYLQQLTAYNHGVV